MVNERRCAGDGEQQTTTVRCGESRCAMADALDQLLRSGVSRDAIAHGYVMYHRARVRSKTTRERQKARAENLTKQVSVLEKLVAEMEQRLKTEPMAFDSPE